jgi:hypothetical protein
MLKDWFEKARIALDAPAKPDPQFEQERSVSTLTVISMCSPQLINYVFRLPLPLLAILLALGF